MKKKEDRSQEPEVRSVWNDLLACRWSYDPEAAARLDAAKAAKPEWYRMVVKDFAAVYVNPEYRAPALADFSHGR
jgi:hypothetical protein